MPTHRLILAFSTLLLLTSAAVPSAAAQSYAQTARSFVQAPQVLGMGDAGVAFGGHEAAFFYNPAKLAHIGAIKPKINLIGARTSISTNVFDQLDYFRNEVRPRIDEGLDTISEEELDAFYNDAVEQGRTWATGTADVLLPSVMLRVSNVGVGGGLFSQTHSRYRLADEGADAPTLKMVFQSDQIFTVSGGMDLSPFGLAGLSAGLTGKYTYRLYGGRSDVLTDFDADVILPLLSGSSLGFDAGLLYAVPALPGDLRVGLAIYDFLATHFNYRYTSTLIGADDDPSADRQAAFAEEASAEHQVSPSTRIGVAYTLPTALIPFVGETGLALDYVGYRNPFIEDQSFGTRLHLGLQMKVSLLAVRTGISQGLLAAGAGVHLGPLHLDYAFYPQEYGRHPGDLTARSHTVQLRFGL